MMGTADLVSYCTKMVPKNDKTFMKNVSKRGEIKHKLNSDRLLNRVKVKVTHVQALRLCTGRTAHRGSRGIVLPFHDYGTRRGWGVSVTPRPLFTPGKTRHHCTGGWVGPRAGLDRCGKSRPPPGFDPRTVQPVAGRYTD